MPNEKLIALAERCEKATGADRELDAEIAAVCKFYDGQHDFARDWSGGWEAVNGMVHLTGASGTGCIFKPAELTDSLDAAVAFVGEMLPGWLWYVGNAFDEFSALVRRDGTAKAYEPDGYCATPALALMAAALRAKAGEEG